MIVEGVVCGSFARSCVCFVSGCALVLYVLLCWFLDSSFARLSVVFVWFVVRVFARVFI